LRKKTKIHQARSSFSGIFNFNIVANNCVLKLSIPCYLGIFWILNKDKWQLKNHSQLLKT